MAVTRNNATYARELARAAGGSILFAFPLVMTMEMWWIGFTIEALPYVMFLAMGAVLLLGLSYYAGFEPDEPFRDVVMDALSAFGISVLVSALLLGVFGVLTTGMEVREIVGKIGIVAVPAAIGALVARKQLQTSSEGTDKSERCSYAGELFLMFAGAVFVAFNVAPTDEIELIGLYMTPWHAVALFAITLIVQHAIVYNVEFRGQELWPADRRFVFVFFSYTVAGYGVALAVSLYVLWTFGRLDGMPMHEIATMMIVLGFPAALGAASARLVI